MLKKLGVIFLFIGLVLLCISGYKAYTIFEDIKTANKHNQETLLELQDLINKQTPTYSYEDELKSLEIDGQEYLGIVDIPSVELSLPVFKDWDYGLLKLGPCRYKGSYLDNDMILMSHYYEDQFEKIKKANIGDLVYFVTADKEIYTYKIDYYETLKSFDGLILEEKTDWDLTLFTCNTYGFTRYVVRCSRVY